MRKTRLMCEEDFEGTFLRDLAERINLLWAAAVFHRSPRSRRFLLALSKELAPPLRIARGGPEKRN